MSGPKDDRGTVGPTRPVPMEAIREFCDRIAEQFRPEKIILFGSYARGTATADSDVDIVVIMPCEPSQFRLSVKILQAIRRDFPLDLIARTPEDVERRMEWGDPFIRDIVEHGVVMYESID